MTNLLFSHPSPDVRAAAIRLLDAFCTWERTTGRHNLVILKDSIGCQCRTMDGRPIPSGMTDQAALEAFESLCAEEVA